MGDRPSPNPSDDQEDEFRLVPLEDNAEFTAEPIQPFEQIEPFVTSVEALPADDPFAGLPPAEPAPGEAIPVEVVAAAEAIPTSEGELWDAVPAQPVHDPLETPVDFELSEEETPVEEDEPVVRKRRRFFLSAVPAWLVSLLTHVGLILILASITLDPVANVISLIEASMSRLETKVEEFDLQGPTLDTASASFTEEVAIPAPDVANVVSLPEVANPTMPSFDANLDALEMNQMTETIIPSNMLNSAVLQQLNVALNSRSAAQKSEMLEKFGGNAASEKAVAMALKWIAQHQNRDGSWSCIHATACRGQCRNEGDMEAKNAATALAILPFLGAGQTHLEGQYKDTVYAGLKYLLNSLDVRVTSTLPTGSWHEPGGRMYSHGLAAITLCEAYAMSRDPDLYQPAQLSLNYLITTQNAKDGGWRYEVGQPGDTSVVGWCLMALKSGKMGNLAVPQQTFLRTDGFLDLMSMNKGALYAYDKPTADLNRIRATTAVGLLCRMYLGYPKEQPAIQEGVNFLSGIGPQTNDLYFSYYATQVMRHHGGAPWESWNKAMRDQLTKSQVAEGHAAGSWSFGGKWSNHGGRLYETSLATMILEVYYRHMPLYSDKSSDADDDFQL